ncbi:glycosyltransferase family 4 protein [Bacillus sp. ISL-34]|uniref:glycosyltransferase family 4 protein n=1 Tax=Bacillus sp. ISL-34 TaxID=2819121 RepID=UPI001BECAB0D|nr:glycosyltransferase family 4 protein [Bacillus sp. ISL-34]MBT2646882.1 glycosyltransferase family 4 protein [Bacillus sp. ISL-34]
MNVLHLNSGLIFGGGLERVIVDLMQHNKECNNFLCIVNDQWSKEHTENLDKNRVLLCNRKVGSKNILMNLKCFLKIYKFIKEKNIHIIHCHNTFSLKLAYFFKKILKLKVVFTVHDTNVYNENLNRYSIDKYIAISKSVYNTICVHVPKEKVKLIYNGVDLDKFIHSKDVNKNRNHLTLTCVARLMPEKKGQDILINALNLLKNEYNFSNFKCYFAGAIENQNSFLKLKHLVEKYKLNENVDFLGNVVDIGGIYKQTDIFILPSRYEGFGLVIVEALAAGCNVIVSKLDGPLEIVKENEEFGLFFEKENYEELAKKIFLLMNNDNYKNKYSDYKKINNYLEKEYSLKRMIKEYNKIYSA